MKFERIRFALSRARHAAIGAAIGVNDRDDPEADARKGWVEFSRNAASSGAAIGGLVGAMVGELRVNAGSGIDRVKERGQKTFEGIVPQSEE